MRYALAGALARSRGSWSLKWGEGRGGSRGWARGAAWMACPPCWWCTLFLLLAPKKWQLGVWSFCILLFVICPNWACMQLLAVTFGPFSFFVFCCSEEAFVRCKHCNQRSQAQPVSLPGDEIGGCLAPTSLQDLGSGVILSHLGITLQSLWTEFVFPNCLQLFSKCGRTFH